MSGKYAVPGRMRGATITFTAGLWALTLLASAGTLLLFACNLTQTDRASVTGLLNDGWFRRSVWLSVATSTVAAVIATVVGLPAAYALARSEFRGKALIEVLFASVIVLPASTLGLLLMVAFQYPPVLALQTRLGFRLVHSLPAIVVAQIPLAMALGIKAWQAAFEAVSPRYEHVARSLGVSSWRAFRTVTLPIAGPGVAAGIILAWTRAVAEYGAVLLFAGTFRMRAPNQFSPLAHALGLNNADMLSLGMWLEIEGGRTERGVAIGFVLLGLSALSVCALSIATGRRQEKPNDD